MLIDLSSFVINPSINVSPYCYSVFRIEPYLTCEHECVYCFARWYRALSINKNEYTLNILGNVKKAFKSLRKRHIKPIPFRLSTLVDPFQPIENQYRISKHIMVLCLKYGIPLIINTKSTLLVNEDYFNILRKLSEEGIVIVQVSLFTCNEELTKILEPRTPPPKSRLDMVEKLSRDNIPVVIRLQPFVPGITDYELKEIIEQAKYAGAKQVIVETLRDEIKNMEFYEKLAFDKQMYKSIKAWESYSLSNKTPLKVLRPNKKWRLGVYMLTKSLCDKYGLEFSACKESFYELYTAKNCCGIHFINKSKYTLRPTLYEAWEYYKKRGKIPSFEELTKNLMDIYVFGNNLKQYPRFLRKKLMAHEKILKQTLNGSKSFLI